MLKIIRDRAVDKASIRRIGLTENISYYKFQTEEHSVGFEIREQSICMIFNYGSAIEVAFHNQVKFLESSHFNILSADNFKLDISISSQEDNLHMDMITVPSDYFLQILEYFSIDAPCTWADHFLFTWDKYISSEIHYNLQTICMDHGSLAEIRAYVHGKFLTILALQLIDSPTTEISRSKSIEDPNHGRCLQMEKIGSIVSRDWKSSYCLKDLAKMAGTNECYLKRDFKAVFGVPISAYRLRKKMEHAKTQLLKSNESIKSISRNLGYKYTTHFTSAFKKYYNITPAQIRQKILQFCMFDMLESNCEIMYLGIERIFNFPII